MSEMYFSVDVEANGPVPGLYSMLSIGVTALHPKTLVEVDHFYRTLATLPEAGESPDTMAWWKGFPDRYAEATLAPEDPMLVMTSLEIWVEGTAAGFGIDVKPIFVAYPIAFDFGFYAYYAHRFTGGAKLGFSGVDMASVAMGYNGREYDEQTKRTWPELWIKPEDRVAYHNALLDARQQADIFRRMLQTTAPTRYR